MKFTQIPADTMKNLQLNAGVLVKSFTPATATVAAEGIIGATQGGVSFTATPTYSDFGEDIDNCPKNMKELKRLDSWEAKMSGSFVSVSADLVKSLVGAATKTADTSGKFDKITPNADLKASDFADIWWIGDYSDVNDGTKSGFLAIHMIDALSTGGFQIQSGDKAKGTFSFEYTAHYSMNAQDTVPFEIYVKVGESA